MSSCQRYQIPLLVGCDVFYSCVFPPSLVNRLHWSNVSAFTSLYFLMYLFIFGWAMSSLLCRLFSSCVEWGRLLVAVLGLLIVVASQVMEHRL